MTAPTASSVKDIELKFNQIPTDNSGCCGTGGLLWGLLIAWRVRGLVNFILDLVVLKSLSEDPFVVPETFFAFVAFVAAELLLLTVEFLIGLKTLWSGKIHAIFFDGVASSISKLSYNRYNVLSRKLKGGCSWTERAVFFVNAQANAPAVLAWLFISLPLTITLFVLVAFRESNRNLAGLEPQVLDILEVVLKLLLSSFEGFLITVCLAMWPLARFFVAKRPIKVWANRRVRRRLHKLYPEIVGKLSGRVPGQPVAPEDDWTESEDVLEDMLRSSSNRVTTDAATAQANAQRDKDKVVEATKKTLAVTDAQLNNAVAQAQHNMDQLSKAFKF